MSDQMNRRSILKAIGATSTVGGGLLASTGLAAADQDYRIKVEWAGWGEGQYHIYATWGDDDSFECSGDDIESDEEEVWFEGDEVHFAGTVDENDSYDAWDCHSMGSDIQVVEDDCEKVNIYQDGDLIW